VPLRLLFEPADDPSLDVDWANTAMLPVANTTVAAMSPRRIGEREGLEYFIAP
jgi:hypothetical protein